MIVTNGKKSEKNYFEVLRSRIKTIYKVKVTFLNGNPRELVEYAIKSKTVSNRVWCVFDKDDFSNDLIYHSLALARKNGIRVAFSNIAFEVWLIEHFCCFDAKKSASELISYLDNLFKKEGYNERYLKNDVNQIKNIFMPRLNKAMENADLAYQKRMADYKQNSETNGNIPVCNWNSYTDVHKLIKALKVDN